MNNLLSGKKSEPETCSFHLLQFRQQQQWNQMQHWLNSYVAFWVLPQIALRRSRLSSAFDESELCSPLKFGNCVLSDAGLHLSAWRPLWSWGGIDCRSLKPSCSDTEAFPFISLGAWHAVQINTRYTTSQNEYVELSQDKSLEVRGDQYGTAMHDRLFVSYFLLLRLRLNPGLATRCALVSVRLHKPLSRHSKSSFSLYLCICSSRLELHRARKGLTSLPESRWQIGSTQCEVMGAKGLKFFHFSVKAQLLFHNETARRGKREKNIYFRCELV